MGRGEAFRETSDQMAENYLERVKTASFKDPSWWVSCIFNY